MLDWTTIHLLSAKGALSTEDARHAVPSRRPPAPRRSFLVPALLLLGLLLVALFLTVANTRRQQEIRALPTEARAQILRHGLDELRTVCREPEAADGALRARCIEQARFLLLLPECGPECRSIAKAALPRARR
jgi:hypothetical protein